MTQGWVRAAEDFTEQADVTNWPARVVLTVVVLALIGLAVWGMARGWRARAARQSDVPPPTVTPEWFSADTLPPVPGVYLASTRAGDWLDRVVVHGLGVRSRARLSVGTAGLVLERDGAADVYVPAADLRGVRLDRGIAGAVYERGGLVVLTWDLGPTTLDTGFRADRTDDHVAVVAAVRALVDTPHPDPA